MQKPKPIPIPIPIVEKLAPRAIIHHQIDLQTSVQGMKDQRPIGIGIDIDINYPTFIDPYC